METTRLSTKGQVIIPKAVREARSWSPGTRLIVEQTKEGILLRPAKLVPRTTLEQVSGMLKYKGKPATIAEMEEAIARMVKSRHARGRY
jgi:AbrB family looped-hinge helix DNA binding protein